MSKLFEVDAAGRLHEVDEASVPPDHPRRHVELMGGIRVLLTEAEMEQRRKDEAAAIEAATAAQAEATAKTEARQAAEAKLMALGLTLEDIAALKG
jgi:hypothetical protein